MRAQGRTYTDEFRAEAVALYRRTDRSVAKVADDLGDRGTTEGPG